MTTQHHFQSQFRLAAFLLGALSAVQLAAQARPPAGLIPVAGFRGQYCSSFGPRGWKVIAENAQRSAFGADMMSPDGRAAASFAIFATGRLNPMPGFQTPDRAVGTNISRMGQLRVRFGRPQQLERNIFAVSYQSSESDGMAFYQVGPNQNGTWMVTLRTAYVASGTWRTRGAEASAVARSLHCNVPNVPAAPDPPILNASRRTGVGGTAANAGGGEGEGDSQYNVWLDKETFHDPISGQNFWVSPSSDFDQNGPQGPGYYAKHANEIIKLQSGYSQ